MLVNGRDCSIVIKTVQTEIDVPYSEETIREAVSLLVEEAAIEGDGVRGAIRKSGGVTGCVVTPLTGGTAPLLLYLAFGCTGLAASVSGNSEAGDYSLKLIPFEDSSSFDLIQDREGEREKRKGKSERRVFEGCRVKGFELRIGREEAIKLKLDIRGKNPPAVYTFDNNFRAFSYAKQNKRYHGDFVSYRINDKEYHNIYGLTLLSRKKGGTRTEIWIKRALNNKPEIPELIEELTITAYLPTGKYEAQARGMFTITARRLVLTADETNINSAGAAIGPLRYYVAGNVSANCSF